MSILVLTSDTLIGTPATGNLEYNGQFYGTDSNASRAQMQRITQGTVVTNPTSPASASIDFTSIPSWVKRITVMFQGVSLSGTANEIVRLGTSGGFVSSGYTAALGLIATVNNTTRAAAYTTYFPITWAGSAAYLVYGNLTITNLTGNTWTATGNFYQDQGAGSFHVINVSGAIALSGVLTQLRITSDASDTFDAGNINLLLEG